MIVMFDPVSVQTWTLRWDQLFEEKDESRL